jgi:hypothetical protein
MMAPREPKRAIRVIVIFGEVVAKILVIRIVTGHTRFRGILLVNALKPRRSIKILPPKMTMTQVYSAKRSRRLREGNL